MKALACTLSEGGNKRVRVRDETGKNESEYLSACQIQSRVESLVGHVAWSLVM
jgi:hypothetical protein